MYYNQSENGATSSDEIVHIEEKMRFNYTQPYPLKLKRWPIFNLLKPDFISQIYRVMIFECGSAAVIATKDNMVYGLGSNKNERLGFESTLYAPYKILYPKEIQLLCGNYIKKFLYSAMCNAALIQNGKVYFWGTSRFQNAHKIPFELYDLKEPIIDIACTVTYFLFLTINDSVYVWGMHNSSVDVRPPAADILNKFGIIEALEGKKVLFIACGSDFSVVITDEDKLYSWGNNEYNQLGHTNRYFLATRGNKRHKFSSAPLEIITLSDKNINKVACGQQHALALTTDGKLYTWGRNNNGQLGIGIDELDFCTPKLLPMTEKIVEIEAVYTSDISVALSHRGYIYIWGWCLDRKITIPTVTKFTNIYDVFADSVPCMIYSYNVDNTNEFVRVNEASSDILNCFKTAFDDPMTSDLIIYVKDKSIHAHKIILKMRSEHFKTILNNVEVGKNWSELKCDQFSYVVYKAFLEYLYTAKIKLSTLEETLELLTLANTYSEIELKNACGELITLAITMSNVIPIYELAIQNNVKNLEKYCFQFIMNQTTAVVSSEFFKNLSDPIQIHLMQEIAAAKAFKT